jgi:membrane protein DedA with SNARE-associated domain
MVGVWERIADLLFGLLDRYDSLMAFLIVLLEEAGVPLHIPADLIMVVAGSRIADGRMSLPLTLLLLEGATLLGASVLYWMAARGGRPLLVRYGRYIHLEHHRLDQAERWVRRNGVLAVIIGRITPGLRIPTVIAAGAFGVPYRVFLPALAGGSSLYICFWVGVGYVFGPRALAMLHTVHLPVRALLSLILFVGLGGILLVMYRRSGRVRRLPRVPATEPRRLELSVLASFLATLEMGLGTNAVLYALSLFGFGEPERELVAIFTLGAERHFDGDLFKLSVALTALFLLGGIGWAIVYTHLFEPLLPWPPWLSGLVFSVLPLLVSLTILLPFLGAGWFGLGLDAGPIPLLGEVARTALFGVGLGTSYALLYAARQPPARLRSPRATHSSPTPG